MAGFAKTRGSPNKRFVDHPRSAARSHKRLIVEASLEERSESARDRHEIKLDRGPPVLTFAREPVVELGRRCGYVWGAAAASAQRQEPVRLFHSRCEEAARPVIFEATADQADAISQQCRGERVTCAASEGTSLKHE